MAKSTFDSASWFRTNGFTLFFYFLIGFAVYWLWVIQPMPYDDWDLYAYPHLLEIPSRGQMWRYSVDVPLFTVDPFGFFRPALIMTGLFFASICFWLFRFERAALGLFLTALVFLGYPYSGHMGPWNISAAQYVKATILFLLWCWLWITLKEKKTVDAWDYSKLFLLTFFSAIWHDFFLVLYFFIVGDIVVQAIQAVRRPHQEPSGTRTAILMAAVVATAYLLAVKYYTNGGTQAFLDERLNRSQVLASSFTWPKIKVILLGGLKENLVLIKDCMPVFCLLGFLKLNAKYKADLLEKYFRLFLVAFIGTIFFTWIIYYLNNGPIHFRVRWINTVVVSLGVLAVPASSVKKILEDLKLASHLNALRNAFLAVAVIWLSFNAYMIYVHTTVDVKAWLSFRERVLKKDETVLAYVHQMPNFFGVTQDDRYRYYWAVTENVVEDLILRKWGRCKAQSNSLGLQLRLVPQNNEVKECRQ